MNLISSVKYLQYLAYIFIFISVESQAFMIPNFLNPLRFNPSYQSTQSNEPSSSQISPKANDAKKVAAKKVAAKKVAAKKAAAKKVAAKKVAAKTNKTASKANKNGNPPSSANIDPLRDLGIDKGYVCFRVKAYTNLEVSEFSQAICTYIKNSKKIKLAWNHSSKAIIGYQVYFGNSAKRTNNFISDVM